MSALHSALQDNKEAPIQHIPPPPKFPYPHALEASWDATWNASGTHVAVAKHGWDKLTVYNMQTRQVVRQALFYRAQHGPPLGVRCQAGLKAQGNSAVWSCSRCCLHKLAEFILGVTAFLLYRCWR